jgi:DNA end-binding protein Ku
MPRTIWSGATELLPPPVELSEDEIEGALALMETMSRDDLDDPEFRDTYTEALAKVIEAKREDQPLPEVPEPAAQPGQLVDLMSALQESVQKAKESRGEDVQELPKKKAGRKASGRKSRSA